MPGEILYRALSPRYAHAPLSGRGAHLSGGRWNAIGTPALYLAGDIITAIHEYQQRGPFKPVTIVQYRLDQARLADTNDPSVIKTYAITGTILDNPWQLTAGLGQIPPSWPIASAMAGDGYHGMRYPSRLTRGQCIVLWRWNDPAAPQLTVIDPDGRLPPDRHSP